MDPPYVLGLDEIDRTQVSVVGGKGAHLGELSRIAGIQRAGRLLRHDRCLSADHGGSTVDRRSARPAVARVSPDDSRSIRELSGEIRRTVEGIAMPDDVAAEITSALARLGDGAAYAVRSSATAEDLPTASFAGQQDTYLNVVGHGSDPRARQPLLGVAVHRAGRDLPRCDNGFDHRPVQMAVVVQQMVFPDAAGVLFTADPVTSNRKVSTVEAAFGLGEALVSGLVNADVYSVRDGEVVATTIGAKQRAVYASPAGGTQDVAVEPRDRSSRR